MRGLFKLPVGFFRLLRLPRAGFARLATDFCILTMRAASTLLAAGAAARSAMKLPWVIMLGPLSGWPIRLPLRETDSPGLQAQPLARASNEIPGVEGTRR